jgi:hypothetical protein
MARFASELFATDFVSGVLAYQDSYPGQEETSRIVLPLLLAGQLAIQAVLDTGAPWCVLDPEIAEIVATPDLARYAPQERLLIRGIRYDGQLYRIGFHLIAELGNSLEIDATVFVPTLGRGEVWSHPNFIGLDGFLNRIRFAIDPDDNAFYFGAT